MIFFRTAFLLLLLSASMLITFCCEQQSTDSEFSSSESKQHGETAIDYFDAGFANDTSYQEPIREVTREPIRESIVDATPSDSDGSIQDRTSIRESTMSVEASCSERQNPCPNFPTRQLFELTLTQSTNGETITIRWIKSYMEYTLVLVSRYYRGEFGPKYSGEVYAFSQTGSQLWKAKVGDGTPMLPVISDNGILLVGVCQVNGGKNNTSFRSIFSGLNVRTGQGVWKKAIIEQNQCYRGAATRKNLFYLIASDIRAFDSSTGQLQWKYALEVDRGNGSSLMLSPVLGAQGIFTLSHKGKLVKLDWDGKLLWETKSLQPFKGTGSIVLRTNDHLYIHNGEYIFAVGPKGTIEWQYPPKNEPNKIIPGYIDMTIDEQENLYFQKFSLNNKGKERWRTVNKRFTLSTPPAPLVYQNGLMYLGQSYGTEIMLFSRDGKWQKAYQGYPNDYSKKTRLSWSSLFGTHSLTQKRELIGVLVDEHPAPNKKKYLFIAIDLGFGELPGSWPTVHGKP